MSDLQYWLALNLLSDIGPVVSRRLLSAFGNPGNIFSMPSEELRNVEGVGEKRARGITGYSQWESVRKEIDYAEKHNIKLITFNDPDYPEGLKRINDAPLVLYIKGNLKDTDKYAVGMVGSRSSTDYGMQTAERMSYSLAASGLTVVSGMARGIDTASHRGALKAGGRTIAVLGSGVNVPYPSSNRGLMKQIENSGAVISEFPFGTPPHKENFPRRNRIISALSFGIIVVEATLDSGSLITVGYALEQGKEVFAVPGSITSRTSRGTNDLIKKGAKLIENAGDVVEELRPQLRGVLREDRMKSENTPGEMNEDEKTLYKLLTSGPRHIDSIIREMNITSGRALSMLLNLELKGVIRQSEGKHFSLN